MKTSPVLVLKHTWGRFHTLILKAKREVVTRSSRCLRGVSSFTLSSPLRFITALSELVTLLSSQNPVCSGIIPVSLTRKLRPQEIQCETTRTWCSTNVWTKAEVDRSLRFSKAPGIFVCNFTRSPQEGRQALVGDSKLEFRLKMFEALACVVHCATF